LIWFIDKYKPNSSGICTNRNFNGWSLTNNYLQVAPQRTDVNTGPTRRWNKKKDTFESSFIDAAPAWRYCIEGTTRDKEDVRIILTFTDDFMPIITVIKL